MPTKPNEKQDKEISEHPFQNGAHSSNDEDEKQRSENTSRKEDHTESARDENQEIDSLVRDAMSTEKHEDEPRVGPEANVRTDFRVFIRIRTGTVDTDGDGCSPNSSIFQSISAASSPTKPVNNVKDVGDTNANNNPSQPSVSYSPGTTFSTVSAVHDHEDQANRNAQDSSPASLANGSILPLFPPTDISTDQSQVYGSPVSPRLLRNAQDPSEKL